MGDLEIRQIREADVEGFHMARSAVALGRRYRATVEPPPLEQSTALAMMSVERGSPFIVALQTNASSGTAM